MKCIFPKLPTLVSVVSALLCNCVAFAQFPPIQWQHCYGGSERDAATAAIPLGDTGFIIAGTAASYNGDRISTFWGGDDFWLVNIDNYGSIKWEKSHGGNFFEACTAITATNSGYLLAGETNSVFGEVSGLHGDLTNPQQDCWIVWFYIRIRLTMVEL